MINNPAKKKTPTFLGSRKYISFEEKNLYETKYEELLRDILDEPVLPIPNVGKNSFQVAREFDSQILHHQVKNTYHRQQMER